MRHLVLLNFKVGCAINDITNLSILVELLEELSRLNIVPNLSKL